MHRSIRSRDISLNYRTSSGGGLFMLGLIYTPHEERTLGERVSSMYDKANDKSTSYRFMAGVQAHGFRGPRSNAG